MQGDLPNTPVNSGGLDAVIDAYKPGIDRTLLMENLRLSVEQRLEKFFALQRMAEELRRAGRRQGDSQQ